MIEEFVFLDVETIVEIHDFESNHRGTASGIRDQGMLESAVGRALNHAAYADRVTPWSIAASLAYGLAKNHPFVDGNKRTSFTAALTVLAMNGYELTSAEDERINAWMLLAEGIVSEANLAEWLEQHSKAERTILEEASDDDE